MRRLLSSSAAEPNLRTMHRSRHPALPRPVRTRPPDPELFAARRGRFLERIGDGVAVLAAAPELFKSRDTEVLYRQNSDFFYLTGFREPGAVAVLTPHDPEHHFTLFVRPRDPEREQWNGPRAGIEGAQELWGADAAYPIDELDEHLQGLLEPADRVVYALGMDRLMDERIIRLLVGFRRSRQRSGQGPTAIVDPDEFLGPMRLIKDATEIEHLRHAARIAEEGHLAAMRIVRPGIGEWQLEAMLEATFRAAGAAGSAYPPIVASGANATILHYVANDRRTRAGDLVLIDAGAEWNMYASDITRTFPVGGRFTPLQRTVYEIVLAAEEAAIVATRPGATVADLHDRALRVLVEGMLELRLLEGDADGLIEEEAHKRFFPHRTSHWLGLDVHDCRAVQPRRGGSAAAAGDGAYRPSPGCTFPSRPRMCRRSCTGSAFASRTMCWSRRMATRS